MENNASIMSPEIKFWLFLVFLVPSVACSIAILYYILSNKNRRLAIHNHAIIILLFNNVVYELVDISLFLNYYRLGTVQPASAVLCLIWEYVDEGLYSISTVVVAWASLERHMLIFHKSWFSTPKRRFFLHYGPNILLISYIIVFHFIVIFLAPCKNAYDFKQEICGHPLCFHDSKSIGTWDSIVNDIIPALMIVVFSSNFVLRVLIQNRRLHRSIQWRKHRMMAVQMLSISILYCILYLPVIYIELAQLCCISQEVAYYFHAYAQFFSYYVMFLLPFTYLASLTESLRNFKRILLRLVPRKRRVQPELLPTTAHIVAQQTL